MSLFGIGGPDGLGVLNGFDCMVMQSDSDRRDLQEQCEAAIAAGINSDAVILELTNSSQFENLMENDQKELISKLEEMSRMRKR